MTNGYLITVHFSATTKMFGTLFVFQVLGVHHMESVSLSSCLLSIINFHGIWISTSVGGIDIFAFTLTFYSHSFLFASSPLFFDSLFFVFGSTKYLLYFHFYAENRYCCHFFVWNVLCTNLNHQDNRQSDASTENSALLKLCTQINQSYCNLHPFSCCALHSFAMLCFDHIKTNDRCEVRENNTFFFEKSVDIYIKQIKGKESVEAFL